MRKKLHHLLKWKGKVKKLKRKITNWNSFFGGDSSEKDCPRNVLIWQELNTYFAERPSSSDTEPLSWWKVNAADYPTISELAKQLLCIPATSVFSERVFSAAGYIVSKLRSALSPEDVDALLFLRQKKSLVSDYQPNLIKCHRKAFSTPLKMFCLKKLRKLKDGLSQSYQLLRPKINFISAKIASYIVIFYNFVFLINSPKNSQLYDTCVIYYS